MSWWQIAISAAVITLSLGVIVLSLAAAVRRGAGEYENYNDEM